MSRNYTIPSDNRELQPSFIPSIVSSYYTIPSDNRELQPLDLAHAAIRYYTIPSDNRELQQTSWWYYRERIIPYQVITGNYN